MKTSSCFAEFCFSYPCNNFMNLRLILQPFGGVWTLKLGLDEATLITPTLHIGNVVTDLGGKSRKTGM